MTTLTQNSIPIHLPISKSISNRVLVLEFLAQQNFSLKNISDANDSQLMVKCLNKIKSTQDGVIDCEDAGTVFRFLTSVLSITQGNWILTGTERMKERPINTLVNALRSMGAEITYLQNEGFPPIQLRGKRLEGGSVTISNSKSSQFISSLMMIAPFLNKGLTINVDLNNQDSAPYIKMTADIMRNLGIKVSLSDSNISIPPSKTIPPTHFSIENDWTAASYFYSIVATQPHLTLFLDKLFANSIQGDSIVSKLFEQLGVKTMFTDDGILISNTGNTVSSFNEDFRNCPDLAQTVAVCCAILKIPATLSGLSSLKIKETDRLNALFVELTKMGGNVRIKNDTLSISPSNYSPNIIETYNDHRMAMAFAPLELLYPDVVINNKSVVRKSFPNFWNEFEKVKHFVNNKAR